MKRRIHLNNVVIVSDTHIGDQFGLCPPDGAKLDGGGSYHPSPAQRVIWSWWEEFWHEWVPVACHGERFAVVIGGDIFDHRHHKSTNQLSQNLADQDKLGYRILKPIRDLCHGHLYLVRGTEAHTGPSAEMEETLGEKLKAVRDEFGNYTRPELRIRVGNEGRVNIMHHIGTTGTTAYESTAILKELIEAYVDAGTWGRHPYDAVVRCHRHRYMMITRPSRNGYAFSLVTPGWQLKTPWMQKLPGARMSTPQFGGVLLRQGDEEFHTRAFVRSVEPPREEIL